jgi:hypothetical protein
MDGVTQLIAKAQRAGLELIPDGERLRIQGPKRAEPLALELLTHKTEVMDLLARQRLSLTAQWTREVADARDGAAWFRVWPSAGRARWAASLAWIAREDRLDVPADLLAWAESLAEGYRE